MKRKEIHCWKCGEQMAESTADYEYDNRFLGRIKVPVEPGELYVCNCGEAPYMRSSLAERVAEYEQRRIEQLLLLSVGGDVHEFKSRLIGMAELQHRLGVSRQAISKSPKYRNRIYHVVINGETLWWSDSVKRFVESGDGRFEFRGFAAGVRSRLRALVDLINGLVPLRSAAMF